MRRSLAAALLLLTSGGAVAAARPAAAQDGAYYRQDALAPQRSSYPSDSRDPRQDGYGRQDDYDQRGPTVRVWLENDRDLFSPGAQTRVFVRASQDAYVAVVHITPDGDVEFLWPRDYYDDGFMDGGQSLALSTRGGRYLRVGSGYGIGYVFAVASDEPLDLRRVRDYYYRRGSGWDASLNVYGDPFHAMERIARLLVPDYDDGYGFLDWYSYNVGSSRYAFPRYACYESYGAWYGSRSSYYDGCDRVRVLLREVPYYYDTRYYRGDRSRYWGRYYASDYRVRRQPEHRYKESTYDGARGVRSPNSRPYVRSGDVPPPRRSGGGGSARDDGQQEPRSTGTQQPSRQRPTLQRRPAESEPVRVSPQPPRSEPRDQGRRAEPRGEPRAEPRTEPRRESPPARSEPRSEPGSEPRSEPRRESPPPSREPSSSGRSAPSEHSAPRVRPNP